jgi:hypothetical protein
MYGFSFKGALCHEDIRGILALVRGEWSVLRPGRFTPRKEPGKAGWSSEPGWMLWSKEKFLAPARNRTPAVHPVVCRYTD